MNKEFRIYRPKKDGTGAATKFQSRVGENKRGYNELFLFWEAAPQTGEETYDWSSPDNKKSRSVTVKLGMPDVAEILLVLSGIKDCAGTENGGIYHQNEKGNATIRFATYKEGYFVKLSSKVGDDLKQIKHSFSLAEGIILKNLLEDFIVRYHDW